MQKVLAIAITTSSLLFAMPSLAREGKVGFPPPQWSPDASLSISGGIAHLTAEGFNTDRTQPAFAIEGSWNCLLFTLPVGQIKPTLRLGLEPYSIGGVSFQMLPVTFGMRYLFNPVPNLYLGPGVAFAALFVAGDNVNDHFAAGALFSGGVEYRMGRFLLGADAGYRLAENDFNTVVVSAKIGWVFGATGPSN
jgi:hypothetical protein